MRGVLCACQQFSVLQGCKSLAVLCAACCSAVQRLNVACGAFARKSLPQDGCAWFTAVDSDARRCELDGCCAQTRAIQLLLAYRHTRNPAVMHECCCRAGIRGRLVQCARTCLHVGRVTDASLFARRAVKDACHVLLWAARGPNLRAVSCSIATAPEHDASEDDA